MKTVERIVHGRQSPGRVTWRKISSAVSDIWREREQERRFRFALSVCRSPLLY